MPESQGQFDPATVAAIAAKIELINSLLTSVALGFNKLQELNARDQAVYAAKTLLDDISKDLGLVPGTTKPPKTPPEA